MAQDVPFFELKGAIESLLLPLHPPPDGTEARHLHPRSPRVAPARPSRHRPPQQPPHSPLRRAGPNQAQHRKLRQPVYLAQIDLATLYDLPLRKITARDLSRYQAVERDFSFVFPDAVQWHTIASAIEALAIPELQSLKPIEVWRNEKKYPGVYSLLVRTIFQSHDRTLRDEELATWSTQIIETLTKLGGTLRA